MSIGKELAALCYAIRSGPVGHYRAGADFDPEGHMAGIEVLDAVKRLGDPSAFKRVTLEYVAIAG